MVDYALASSANTSRSHFFGPDFIFAFGAAYEFFHLTFHSFFLVSALLKRELQGPIASMIFNLSDIFGSKVEGAKGSQFIKALSRISKATLVATGLLLANAMRLSVQASLRTP